MGAGNQIGSSETVIHGFKHPTVSSTLPPILNLLCRKDKLDLPVILPLPLESRILCVHHHDRNLAQGLERPVNTLLISAARALQLSLHTAGPIRVHPDWWTSNTLLHCKAFSPCLPSGMWGCYQLELYSRQPWLSCPFIPVFIVVCYSPFLGPLTFSAFKVSAVRHLLGFPFNCYSFL